jgi:hypothetical protein
LHPAYLGLGSDRGQDKNLIFLSPLFYLASVSDSLYLYRMDSSGTLHKKTFLLIVGCVKPLPKIARDTGLSYFWLRKFKQNAIPNPSVNSVQKLYEYLSGEKLGV